MKCDDDDLRPHYSAAFVTAASVLDRVTAALAAITSQGAFAAEQAWPSDDLVIEVKGVGVLRFPLSATTACALCAIAHPAPFGRRDKTLRDVSVRDTWEIGNNRLKIDARRWKRTLEPALASLRTKLGLSDDGKLIAVLDKMLVYTPGQFFAAHQDSEKPDGEKRRADRDVGVKAGGDHSMTAVGGLARSTRWLSTITPSMAIRRRKPTTSTGSR